MGSLSEYIRSRRLYLVGARMSAPDTVGSLHRSVLSRTLHVSQDSKDDDLLINLRGSESKGLSFTLSS